MTDGQNIPPNTAQANTATPPVLPTPPLIDLSPREQASLNALMRSPSEISINRPLLTLDREVRAVAGPLVHCQVGQFCAADVIPPQDLRASQSFNVGNVEGRVTVQPGKVKLRVPF